MSPDVGIDEGIRISGGATLKARYFALFLWGISTFGIEIRAKGEYGETAENRPS
jgi:hypothetical protein